MCGCAQRVSQYPSRSAGYAHFLRAQRRARQSVQTDGRFARTPPTGVAEGRAPPAAAAGYPGPIAHPVRSSFNGRRPMDRRSSVVTVRAESHAFETCYRSLVARAVATLQRAGLAPTAQAPLRFTTRRSRFDPRVWSKKRRRMSVRIWGTGRTSTDRSFSESSNAGSPSRSPSRSRR